MSSWIIQRDRLDLDQKRVIDAPITGNMWISGYAGSGKSVLLVHKALSILNREPAATIIFVVYTSSLVDLFRTGLAALGYPQIPVKTIYEFMNDPETFDYVLCDEIQDCTDRMIDAIKNKARKNVIVAGDEFQSIYEKDVKFRESTINVTALRNNFSNIYELSKIYRLTPSIIHAIDTFMPSMQLMLHSKPNAQKQDVTIKLCKAAGRQQESEYVYNSALLYLRQFERTAVLFSQYKECLEFVNFILSVNSKPAWEVVLNRYGKPDFGELNAFLECNGIKLMYIGNSYGSLQEAEKKGLGVMMTYQSSKGLDFENVYLPFMSNNLFITYDEARCRTIFMVAMSRSSKNLTLTYSGFPYQYVNKFRSQCVEVTPDTGQSNSRISEQNYDFDF